MHECGITLVWIECIRKHVMDLLRMFHQQRMLLTKCHVIRTSHHMGFGIETETYSLSSSLLGQAIFAQCPLRMTYDIWLSSTALHAGIEVFIHSPLAAFFPMHCGTLTLPLLLEHSLCINWLYSGIQNAFELDFAIHVFVFFLVTSIFYLFIFVSPVPRSRKIQ